MARPFTCDNGPGGQVRKLRNQRIEVERVSQGQLRSIVLTREGAAELAAILQRFSETGTIEEE